MRKKIGILCMLLGALMVAAAASVFVYNLCQSNSAAKTSQTVMPVLRQEITENSKYNNPKDETPSFYIDGYDYIGYLTIPSLNLELPVMSGWDYTRLTYAPCRYYGSAENNDLVIAAHNYSSHFGRLWELKIGDEVIFTGMDGTVDNYSVGDIEALPPDAVLDMIESDWDLTLYTCNYAGTQRVTVRCCKMDDE